MIIDGVLFVLKEVLAVLLSPLETINVAIDFIGSIPVVSSFIQVVAYVLPWSNILPVIYITIAFFIFRAAVALIKTFWDLLPLI